MKARKGIEYERRTDKLEVKGERKKERRGDEDLRDSEQHKTSTEITFSKSVLRTKRRERNIFYPLSSCLFCLKLGSHKGLLHHFQHRDIMFSFK